ncbi:hypothetical protein J6590_073491 [Homalodisca vitripennis]|nr:hypothetical protein J6590_073491 [Homalodisca vitripennis]
MVLILNIFSSRLAASSQLYAIRRAELSQVSKLSRTRTHDPNYQFMTNKQEAGSEGCRAASCGECVVKDVLKINTGQELLRNKMGSYSLSTTGKYRLTGPFREHFFLATFLAYSDCVNRTRDTSVREPKRHPFATEKTVIGQERLVDATSSRFPQ